MHQIIYHTIATIKNTEKSQVYLATMEGREEPVIIKRMNTANPDVYKALKEIHNEHIPQIYATELQENELVVAEEYVDGETLEHYLKEGLLTEEQKLKMSFAVRSSMESAKYYLTDKVRMFTEMLGGTIEIKGDYPGWEYRPDSPLRDTFVSVYERIYGKRPKIQAIHAGLECGMFTGKIKDLDCISFGPNMKNVHTFEETLEVESVRRTWEYLCQILAEKL